MRVLTPVAASLVRRVQVDVVCNELALSTFVPVAARRAPDLDDGRYLTDLFAVARVHSESDAGSHPS